MIAAADTTWPAALPVRLARLGGALRAAGAGTSLREELDAADALTLVDRADRDEVKRALRIALRIPRPWFDAFDGLFQAFWRGDEPTPPAPRAPRVPPVPSLRWDPDRRQLVGGAESSADRGDEPGYSPQARLRRRSFDEMAGSDAELAAMEHAVARLARRLRAHRSRRWVPTRGRGRPDLRASYRRALATAGELIALRRRTRALEDPRLVFLCDTSGSMDAHTRFLLTFALSVRKVIPRAEVFAFNTQLQALSRALTPGKVPLVLDRLAAEVPDWSGGTRIGACLAAFVEQHLPRCVDARTTVFILSDGLDRGDLSQLADALAEIRRRARAIIWLNPLLGDPRYKPLAAGMAAALPFVDYLAPAHDLASLERLLTRLQRPTGLAAAHLPQDS